MQDRNAMTVLDHAARSGSPESIRFIIGSLYPESQRFQAVILKDAFEMTVLHDAGNLELMEYILSFVPESKRSQAVLLQGQIGMAVLHCAAFSGHFESFELILSLFPKKSDREMVLTMQDQAGKSVLHAAAYSNNLECFKAILSLSRITTCTESVQDDDGDTVLHHAALSGYS